MIVAVVPIKSFRDGNRRLASVLTDEQRAAIGRSMAGHVTETLQAAGALVTVISDDPEVREWATCDVIDDPGGLDAAARMATGLADGEPWMVVHADLPLLSRREVDEVTGSALAGRTVIAPSHDGGTSVIAGRGQFRFAYGPGSFHRHLAASPTPPHVLVSLGTLLDVDDPRSLEAAGRSVRSPQGASP